MPLVSPSGLLRVAATTRSQLTPVFAKTICTQRQAEPVALLVPQCFDERRSLTAAAMQVLIE